jgi:hypothetical protein
MIKYATIGSIDPTSDIQEHGDYWIPHLRGA